MRQEAQATSTGNWRKLTAESATVASEEGPVCCDKCGGSETSEVEPTHSLWEHGNREQERCPDCDFSPLTNAEQIDLFRQMQKWLDQNKGKLKEKTFMVSEMENIYRLRQTVYQLQANVRGGDTAIRALEQQCGMLERENYDLKFAAEIMSSASIAQPSQPEVIAPESYSNATAVDLESGTFDFAAIDNSPSDLPFHMEDVREMCEIIGDDASTRQERSMALQSLVNIVAPPEVIEGQGQVVINSEQVTYWQKRLDKCRDGIYPLRFGCSDTASGGITITDGGLNVWDVLLQLYRDAELLRDFANEVLPPRATFQAPAKPELVKVRYKGREDHYVRRDGDNFRLASGRLLCGINCEVIDETTGKVIQGE